MSLLVLLQDAVAATDWVSIAKLGAAFAASIAVIGAAMGISKIGASALESMARQPEAASNIQSSMILAAAFVEGVSLFAVVVCLLVAVA